MEYTEAQYPALIYKSSKGNVYVANCIVKNLIGYGHSEVDAINNLQNILSRCATDSPIKVKPVYKFLPALINA